MKHNIEIDDLYLKDVYPIYGFKLKIDGVEMHAYYSVVYRSSGIHDRIRFSNSDVKKHPDYLSIRNQVLDILALHTKGNI